MWSRTYSAKRTLVGGNRARCILAGMQSAAPKDSALVFLHTRKTAGTTMNLVLRRQYRPACDEVRACSRTEPAAVQPQVGVAEAALLRP